MWWQGVILGEVVDLAGESFCEIVVNGVVGLGENGE